MTPASFRRWRKHLGFSQREAAAALGIAKRRLEYLETGERDGQTVEIPLNIRLACAALALGLRDYAGPE